MRGLYGLSGGRLEVSKKMNERLVLEDQHDDMLDGRLGYNQRIAASKWNANTALIDVQGSTTC
jgi:hypothetical protein